MYNFNFLKKEEKEKEEKEEKELTNLVFSV